EADEDVFFLGNVAHRETGTMPVTPGGAVDRREQLARLHPSDVPERILEHALLHRDLRRRIEVLQAAAATDAKIAAGGRHARGARDMELGDAREIVVALAAKDLDIGLLADQPAFDEHGLAVDPSDPTAFLIERGDDDGFHAFGRAWGLACPQA